MNRILKFILLSVMLIFLVACNKLKSGVVIDKYERSSYTSTIYVSNGKYGGYVIPIYYPESYHVIVKGKHQGKTIKEDFEISKSRYKKIKIGDNFVNEEKK
ncbi:MAG: hypothetical protein E6491_05085 [Streptococcus anginosus]|nr:hypothetical protein [Streptococcus anginosus]